MTVYVRAADVAEEIVTRLEQIKISDGAETDIGRRVLRGRRTTPIDSEVPCSVLIEAGDEVEDSAGRTMTALVKVRNTYMIDGFTTCDPDNPNVAAHAMIRDLKRSLFKDGRTFGGKVVEVSYKGRDIGPRPDGAGFVQARIMIEVSFAEDLANP
jgi:hypothetical protein